MPSGGKYDKTLLLLEEVGPAGGVQVAVAGGTVGIREFLGAGRGTAAGASIPGRYLVPLKLCSPGAS